MRGIGDLLSLLDQLGDLILSTISFWNSSQGWYHEECAQMFLFHARPILEGGVILPPPGI